MSSRSSKRLWYFRLVVFWKTILSSLIVLSLTANFITITNNSRFNFYFAPLALATAVLSKLTVITMFVVDIRRQGSIFSYIIVEIVWLSILSLLWLSSGSYAAWTDNQLIGEFPGESNCNFGLFGSPLDVQVCHEIKGIMAFSFLAWILLMCYALVLLVLAIRAQERGNRAWTTSVRDGVLFYSPRKTMEGAAEVQTALATIPNSLPPPQQPLPQQLPPQQLPPQQLPPQQLPPQRPHPPYPSSLGYPIPQV